MKKAILIILVLTALLTASCAITVNQPVPSEPTVIYVPVTVTSAPQEELPQAQPTATLEPLPTIAEAPTATSVPAATATSENLHFYVSGYVWHDMCAPVNGPIPNPLPVGCVTNSGGGLSANGIFDAGEPGLAGVVVRLEIDCSYGAFTTATDGSGFYKMSFTVPKSAGVSKQKICLSIDALSSENVSLLIPGGWTFPATNSATALVQITIEVETQNTVNFGWDFQFQ
jgi:hypothetical protein